MNSIRNFKVFLNTLSDYCVKNNYPYLSDVKFTLQSPLILSNPHNKFLVSVSDMVIPISWAQISSYFANNTLNYTVNNVSYSFTFSDGSYSCYDIINSFTNNLNGLVVTYSNITNKFTFTHDTYNFTLNFTTSGCYQELGFYNGITYSSTNRSLTSVLSIDLSGSREVYISCDNVRFNNIDSRTGTISHILDHIPIDVSNYSILRYNNITNFKCMIIDNTINYFNIILYDDQNYIIPIKHNWSLTLEFSEVIIPNHTDFNMIAQKQNDTEANIGDADLEDIN